MDAEGVENLGAVRAHALVLPRENGRDRRACIRAALR